MQGLTPCIAWRRDFPWPQKRTPQPLYPCSDGTATCGCQSWITFVAAFLCCWFLGAKNSLCLSFAQVGKVFAREYPSHHPIASHALPWSPHLFPLISFSTNLGCVFLCSLQTTHFVFFCPTFTNVITNNHATESILGSHAISHSKEIGL